jgi:GT2 family glycosyltransferase
MSFRVVILSSRASNLIPCVRAVLTAEPSLSPGDIIVVDDGARASAEASLPRVRWITGITPFIFARNANLGFFAADSDAILLNDDACLTTPRGFSALAAEVAKHAELGICSAGIHGAVGNPRQIATGSPHLRYENRGIAFICVFIPWRTYMQLGAFDERFSGYGFEDNDYCARVLASGLKIGIWDSCVVDHSGSLPSTFRTRPDLMALFEQNRQLYRSKWGKDA